MFDTLLLILLAVLALLDIATFFEYRKAYLTLKAMKESGIQDWVGLAENDNEVAYLMAAKDAFELFKKKNHDYGSDNLNTTGVTGVVVRSMDKTSRLKSLVLDNKSPKNDDEKVGNTFIDMANYGLIGYAMSNGYWQIPTVPSQE